MYPFAKRLAFNPVDTSWIPLALSDDVFFSTILFSAASHLSFIQGQKNATLPAVILQSVFRALGERLGAQKDLTDATVGAVTCLAQVEVDARLRSDSQDMADEVHRTCAATKMLGAST